MEIYILLYATRIEIQAEPDTRFPSRALCSVDGYDVRYQNIAKCRKGVTARATSALSVACDTFGIPQSSVITWPDNKKVSISDARSEEAKKRMKRLL